MAKSATVHGEKKKKKKKQHTSMRSSTQSSFLQLVVPSQLRPVVHAVGTCCEPKAAKPVRRSPTSAQRRGRRNGETGPGRRTNQHHGSLPTPESTDGQRDSPPDHSSRRLHPDLHSAALDAAAASRNVAGANPAWTGLAARSSTASSLLRRLTPLPVPRGCRPLRTSRIMMIGRPGTQSGKPPSWALSLNMAAPVPITTAPARRRPIPPLLR